MIDAAAAHGAEDSLARFKSLTDEDWAWDANNFAEEKTPTVKIFAIDPEGRGVGLLWACPSGTHKRARLNWAYVDRQSPHEGIFLGLLQYAATWALTQGWTSLTGEVRIERIAEHLVDTYGFDVISEEKDAHHLQVPCAALVDRRALPGCQASEGVF
ncbi:hypothetical protein [Actinospongicola halichondriae]|uniref:hypothetical protein n=1 Tax=Actinospongicola halichondriae TaxID=3236844 RepID=UPI003D4780B7